MKKLFVIVLGISCFVHLHAVRIPLRNEICLSGKWEFTPKGGQVQKIDVPDYWDAHQEYKSVDEAVFEREVLIPESADWKGQIIKLEFEAVNFQAEVFINNKLLGSHTGGWIPFSIDITKYVTPGKSFKLKVNVKGGNHPPTIDERGLPVWPVGFFGQKGKWGIVFDVWLRAYGPVSINDAYIQTSYRNSSIKVEYRLGNVYKNTRDIKIIARAVSALNPDETVLEFEPVVYSCKTGLSEAVTIETAWKHPDYWSPDDPNLYYLETKLFDISTDELLDREIRRFGFREVWVEGARLLLNGQRLTILGANLVQHSEFYDNQNYYLLSRESWNSTIDRLFELNLRTVRFHMQPAPRYMLDIADERGLLVMDESGIYAREFILEVNKKAYLENSYRWIESWVKDRRNHPSIIVWNAENEMGVGWLKWMTSEEMKSLGDCIRKFDTTRPVNYDGDRDVGDQMVNMHYPEVYKGTVKGSIYSWADSLHPEKPTGVGEFLTHYGENGLENQWWQGTWIRGMRYVYFSDIRPYRHDWAIIPTENTECIENLRRSLSPVALFDKAYDDLGIDPLLYKNLPVLNAGDTVNRELILYNDDYSDTIITIEVLIRTSDYYHAIHNYNGDRTALQRVIAQGSGTYSIPLGEHMDIPYSFIVPAIHEGFVERLDIELIARKKGEVRFKETISFNLRNEEFTADTPSKIILYDAEQPDFFGR